METYFYHYENKLPSLWKFTRITMEIHFRRYENLSPSRRQLRPMPVALFRRRNPGPKKKANPHGVSLLQDI
jgi:hypothetical protein